MVKEQKLKGKVLKKKSKDSETSTPTIKKMKIIKKKKDVSSVKKIAKPTKIEEEDDNVEIPVFNSGKKIARKQVNEKKVVRQIPSDDSEESDFGEGPSRPALDSENDSEQEELMDFDDEELSEQEENASEQEDEQSDDDEIKDIKKFRESMANLPLAEVRAMKEKLGIKLFNKAYFGTSEADKKKEEAKKEEKESQRVVKKRVNQHRPLEVSSKKKVGVFRNFYGDDKPEKKRWDPRFDERVGEFKEGCFDSNYAFLDDLRKDEREQLKHELSDCMNSGDSDKAERLAQLMRRMEDQEKSRKEKQLVKSAMHEIREENIERMMQGQHPVFKTKAQVREKIMEKKFEQLKKEHKLDTYVKRKAKKDAQKAKKSRPDIANFETRYGYQQ